MSNPLTPEEKRKIVEEERKRLAEEKYRDEVTSALKTEGTINFLLAGAIAFVVAICTVGFVSVIVQLTGFGDLIVFVLAFAGWFQVFKVYFSR